MNVRTRRPSVRLPRKRRLAVQAVAQDGLGPRRLPACFARAYGQPMRHQAAYLPERHIRLLRISAYPPARIMRRRLNRDRTRVQLRHLRYFVKIVDAGTISSAVTVIQFKFFNAAGSVALIAALSVAATSTAHAQDATSKQFPFSAPNTNEIPAGPLGDAIRYGEKVAAQTQTYAKKYVGNGLNCTSCHLDGGKTPYAAPWVGIWGQFPQYRSRNGRVDTLQDRINDCFERSMNGKALRADSTEMIGLLSYMRWLSKDVPTGAEVEGNGFIQIKLPPANQIDPARGKQIYAQQCGSCHGLDGQGRTDCRRISFSCTLGRAFFQHRRRHGAPWHSGGIRQSENAVRCGQFAERSGCDRYRGLLHAAAEARLCSEET